MNLKELSKEISYALRHAPWEYELELDEEGFVPIEQLLHSLNQGGNYVDDRPVTKEDLEEIIRTSDKKRHEIVGDRIRALYGHSVPRPSRRKLAPLRTSCTTAPTSSALGQSRRTASCPWPASMSTCPPIPRWRKR